MRTFIALLLFTGSASAEPATRSERALVIEWAKQTYREPYGMRSTGITDLFPAPDGSPMFCVEYNPRNGLGGYEGIDRMGFVRTTTGTRPATRGLAGVTDLTCFRYQGSMQPFPELAAIR